jgi:hypothetical protein
MRNKRIFSLAIIMLLLALVVGTVFAQSTKSVGGVAYTPYQESGRWYTEMYNSNRYDVKVTYRSTNGSGSANTINIDAKETIDLAGRFEVTRVVKLE